MSIDMNTNVPGFGRYMNLLSFAVNFSKYASNDLFDQSPDYILEKYDHWIGAKPVTDHPHYTPDNYENFFHRYQKRWKCDITPIKRPLLFLLDSEHLHLTSMVNSFEKYFGPIDLISDHQKSGLHVIIEQEFIPKILELNEKQVKSILRHLKIDQVI